MWKELPMKRIALCLALSLACATVQAKDLIVTVDGKDVTIDCTTIQQEIKTADKDKGSQVSATACSFLLYSLLSKNDIQGASKLYADPEKAVEKWTTYRDRVGVEDFKKDMDAYFKSKNVVLAELVLAEDTLLVIKTEHGPVGQFYQKKDKHYLAADKPAKTLGEVLNQIREGKIKLN
jgi:hypothetical protein